MLIFKTDWISEKQQNKIDPSKAASWINTKSFLKKTKASLKNFEHYKIFTFKKFFEMKTTKEEQEEVDSLFELGDDEEKDERLKEF